MGEFMDVSCVVQFGVVRAYRRASVGTMADANSEGGTATLLPRPPRTAAHEAFGCRRMRSIAANPQSNIRSGR